MKGKYLENKLAMPFTDIFLYPSEWCILLLRIHSMIRSLSFALLCTSSTVIVPPVESGDLYLLVTVDEDINFQEVRGNIIKSFQVIKINQPKPREIFTLRYDVAINFLAYMSLNFNIS